MAVLSLVPLPPASAGEVRAGGLDGASESLTEPLAARAVMGAYPESDYSAEAAVLPDALVDALQRDLGISGERYLASADAAADASEVVEALSEAGVDVVGSELDSTRLTVAVGSRDDFERVRSAGAVPTLGVSEERTAGMTGFRKLADVRGGSGYTFTDGDQTFLCSAGLNGYSVATGDSQLLTAGHCRGTGYRALVQQRPGPTGQPGVPLGEPVAGSFEFGGGYDYGLIETAESLGAPPEVLTWGGGTQAPTASAPLQIRNAIAATVGASVCKSGSRTGWTCGTVLEVDSLEDVDGGDVNLIVTDACMLPGDSGGAAVIGGAAIGVNSAGTALTTCDSRTRSGFFPLVSGGGYESVQDAIGGVWEPAVRVETPQLTLPSNGGSIFAGRPMTGRVTSGAPGQTVRLDMDGVVGAFSAPVSGTGRWQIDLDGLALGSHTYTAVTTWGEHSRSTPVSGTFRLSALPSTDRIGGTDRFDGAVRVSKAAFPDGASVVYLVSGLNFPDALSASPAAVKQGGPLLLTLPGSLPPVVSAELDRLSPERIVVVGGDVSVSPAVVDALERRAEVIQLSGADRYATSLAVADYAFTETDLAYVATGTNFPDALSAGTAAAASGAPVILVPGFATSVSPPVRTLLDSLGVTSVKIAGGLASVSAGVESSLGASFSTTRFAGADRFDTSHLINMDRFPTSSRVFVANGFNYPDALSGSAFAGKTGSPMFISPPACVPARILDDIGRMGASRVTLLGGEAVLNPSVRSLASC